MHDSPLIGPVRYKHRDGFINHEGEFVIEPVFEMLGLFREGLACFKEGGKFGFIDAKGTVVIRPIFESTRVAGPFFSSGLAAVRENGKAGYIDRTGKWMIPPKFSCGRDFLDEFAIVDLPGLNRQSFVMDKNGQLLTRLDVFEVPDFQGNWEMFSCFFGKDPNLLVGFMNWEGEIKFPPKYPCMTLFHEGIAGFSEQDLSDQGPYGLVELSGEVMMQPIFYNMSDFEDGLARASRARHEVGFINSVGEWVLDPIFWQAQPFSEGLACVTVKDNSRRGKKGFINRNGEMVIEPRFDREASFHQGVAHVEYEGKFGIIDKTGRLIWETEVETV